jgi:hypothetical protein
MESWAGVRAFAYIPRQAKSIRRLVLDAVTSLAGPSASEGRPHLAVGVVISEGEPKLPNGYLPINRFTFSINRSQYGRRNLFLATGPASVN